MNIGERVGLGLHLILKTTKEEYYPSPIIFDKFNPDVSKFTVFINKATTQDENELNNNQKPNDCIEKPNDSIKNERWSKNWDFISIPKLINETKRKQTLLLRGKSCNI